MMLITLSSHTQNTSPTTVEITLLDLVGAVGEITQDEQELVATIQYMLSSGRVRLLGEFCEEEIAVV